MTLLNLPEKTTNPSDESDFNNMRDALSGDILPRNSSGVATDLAGDLGSSTYSWLQASVVSGYLAAGYISPFYDYDGLLTIPQGWMLCDGSQITRANYNVQHRTGVSDTTDYWAIYVGSTTLEGLYLPGGDKKFLSGSTSTLPNGASAIPEAANANSEINLTHAHGPVLQTSSVATNRMLTGVNNKVLNSGPDHYHEFTFGNGLGVTDVTPVSIDVKFLLRIVE